VATDDDVQRDRADVLWPLGADIHSHGHALEGTRPAPNACGPSMRSGQLSALTPVNVSTKALRTELKTRVALLSASKIMHRQTSRDALHADHRAVEQRLTCCNGRPSERLPGRKKLQVRLRGSPRRSMVHGSQKATGECNSHGHRLLHSPAAFGEIGGAHCVGTAPAGTAARQWLRGRTDALIALACCFWWRINASERSSVRPSTLVTFIVYSRCCSSSLARRLHEP
jgi:hypothetical protein